MRRFAVLLAVVLSLACSPSKSHAGRIFVTGHDPIWHSHFGPNFTGARNIAHAGINFARGTSSLPFLFVESITTSIPSGNARTAPFLISDLGYGASDFTVMDGAALSALADFRSTLDSFSAIVVASDHGGMLTAAELGFLNAHSGDIIDYINGGGGVYAEAESNTVGLIGSTARFGFLPFVVSSTDFGEPESGNTVTAYGATKLGLANADSNGNFSHNFFNPASGMQAVDLRNGNTSQPLTLAFDGQSGTVTSGGISSVPEPSSLFLFGVGVLVLCGRGRRRVQGR